MDARNIINNSAQPPSSESHPILIIGGGLAGLSLAQALKQHSIPFRIFERDTSASFRAQGYRIRISPTGAEALRQLLSALLFDAFEATCATIVHGGHALDAISATENEFHAPGWGSRPPHSEGKAYNADRATLRSLLMYGLRDQVEFDKKFEKYEPKKDSVVAYFADGSRAEGKLLIGADGIRSAVRRQYLPEMSILDTEGRAVFGKTLVTDRIRRQLPAQIGSGLTIASAEDEVRLRLFTDGMYFDRKASAGFEDQLGLEVPDDYIYWVLVFRSDLVEVRDKALLTCSCERSKQLSLDLTAEWHDSLRILIQDQITEAASTLAFLTSGMGFAKDWSARAESNGRVTLLGDAAHPMPPVGGLGANAGFQDAASLFELLKAEQRDWIPSRTLARYEEKMIVRALPFLNMSSGGAGRFFGMRPMEELKPATLWH